MIEDDDGSMSDMHRAMREYKQRRRAEFRERAPQVLTEAGIPFRSRNAGAHLMVGTEVVNYWPGTGLWRDPASGKEGRGIATLLAFIRKREGSREPVTPFNPSPAAIQRVPPEQRIPLPAECPKCHGPVTVCDNSALYGRRYGRYPWCVMCKDPACGCAVGFHPETNIPLGTMADRPTRSARSRCKDAFNPLWMHGAMTRNGAYAWLARELGIPVDACHIGRFDIEQCNAALAAIQKRSTTP